MINTVYHNNICEEMLERFNSYRGVVRIETKSGCIVRLENAVDVYVFGSFQIGDVIEVGITKILKENIKAFVNELFVMQEIKLHKYFWYGGNEYDKVDKTALTVRIDFFGIT